MKKITVLLLLLIASHLPAQNIKAEYIFEINLRIGKELKEQTKRENKEITDKMFEDVFKFLEQDNGKTATYVLTVKDSLSSYILQPNEFDGSNFSYDSAKDVEGIFFSNIEKGNIVRQKQFKGNWFLVSYQKADIIWHITDETKKIGNYDCIKATTKLKEIRNKKIAEREFEVWFTPAIPSKAGPMLFSGLPGLVIYVTDNKTTQTYLKNIEINPEITENIVFPKKGKTVTEAEFLEYQRKNL